jgi:hypothetical protein
MNTPRKSCAFVVITLKDLNNDGWQDIVVAAYGVNNVKIRLNLC